MVFTPEFLWDKLIGHALLDIVGNPYLLAGVAIFFFYIWALALRLSWEIQIMMLFFLSMFILGGLIPAIASILLPVLGFFIGMFLIYLLFKG